MSILGGAAGRQTHDVGVGDDRRALHLANVLEPVRRFGHFSDGLEQFFEQIRVVGTCQLPGKFGCLRSQVEELLLEALFKLVEGRVLEARGPGPLLDRAEVVRLQELGLGPSPDPNDLLRDLKRRLQERVQGSVGEAHHQDRSPRSRLRPKPCPVRQQDSDQDFTDVTFSGA